MPKVTVELTDDQHRRFVNAKLDRKFRSIQELFIRAAEAYIRPPADPGSEEEPGKEPFGDDDLKRIQALTELRAAKDDQVKQNFVKYVDSMLGIKPKRREK